MPKVRIGWFSFTCCEDSTIIFTELLNTHWEHWKDSIEFINARVIKESGPIDHLDVSFVEGAMSSQDQVEKLKAIRQNSRYLIAVGSCACTAMPAGWRNTFDEKTKAEIAPIVERFSHLPKMEPIKKYVAVDENLPGCPMDEKQFLVLMDKVISGKLWIDDKKI